MDHRLELTGTPDEVQAMLNVASKVEPGIYKKKRNTPGSVTLWYRGDAAPSDLATAIKKRAAPKKAKTRARGKKNDIHEQSQVQND